MIKNAKRKTVTDGLGTLSGLKPKKENKVESSGKESQKDSDKKSK